MTLSGVERNSTAFKLSITPASNIVVVEVVVLRCEQQQSTCRQHQFTQPSTQPCTQAFSPGSLDLVSKFLAKRARRERLGTRLQFTNSDGIQHHSSRWQGDRFWGLTGADPGGGVDWVARHPLFGVDQA